VPGDVAPNNVVPVCVAPGGVVSASGELDEVTPVCVGPEEVASDGRGPDGVAPDGVAPEAVVTAPGGLEVVMAVGDDAVDETVAKM